VFDEVISGRRRVPEGFTAHFCTLSGVRKTRHGLERMTLFRYEKTIYEKSREGLVLQVIEKGDQRQLRFGNHIVQSAISLSSPDGLVLDYTRAMVTALLFPPRLNRFLHLGLGGGTLVRFFYQHLPTVHQRVVELNPEVIEVARRYFDLPNSVRLTVVQAEGAEFMRADTEHYDLIFLDAFDAEGADARLHSQTIYTQLRERLAPDGWLVNNVWGSDRANLFRVRDEMVEVFAQVFSLSVRADSNVILIGGNGTRLPTATFMRRRARLLSRRMGLDLEAQLGRVTPLRSGA